METLTFVCLDTSFLIDFLRGETNARITYLQLRSAGYRFATTTISVFEIFRGVDKRGRIKGEEESVRKLLSRIVVWNLDIESTERCSRIYTEMKRAGMTVGINDCFTAAIAISNGCQKIPGIERIPH